MHSDYWQRQDPSKPLFDDLLWSRPENKQHSGKLLIVGGNAHGFAAPALAFSESVSAGVGATRVLLPEHVKKSLPKGFFEADFLTSTPSGSFSKLALAELLDHTTWAEGVLLAGDFGRNSETAILLEQFAQKYSGQLTVTKDAADYYISAPLSIKQRGNVVLVISFAQLQKLAIQLKFPMAFTFDMDYMRLLETLNAFTKEYDIKLVIKHLETLFVAVSGQISSTRLDDDTKVWRVRTASHAAVWWLQNPTKPFEALTTSCVNS